MNAKELIEAQDLFEMANIVPRDSGLPFTIWISPGTNDRHVPRLKVEVSYRNFIPVSIEDSPRQLAGSPKLSSEQLDLVGKFVRLNKELLLSYWTGETTSTKDVLLAIKSV